MHYYLLYFNIFTSRFILPILPLKYRARLMHNHTMPSSQRHLYPVLPFSRTNPKSRSLYKTTLIRRHFSIMHLPASIHIRPLFTALDSTALLLIKHPIQTPFKTYHRLRTLQMSMYRQASPNLQRIQPMEQRGPSCSHVWSSRDRGQQSQHPPTPILRRRPQIKVHP